MQHESNGTVCANSPSNLPPNRRVVTESSELPEVPCRLASSWLYSSRLLIFASSHHRPLSRHLSTLCFNTSKQSSHLLTIRPPQHPVIKDTSKISQRAKQEMVSPCSKQNPYRHHSPVSSASDPVNRDDFVVLDDDSFEAKWVYHPPLFSLTLCQQGQFAYA